MTGREKGSSESPLKKFACQNRGTKYQYIFTKYTKKKTQHIFTKYTKKISSTSFIYSYRNPSVLLVDENSLTRYECVSILP